MEEHVHDMGDGMGPTATATPMTTTHMTFFWGKNAAILFEDWPGDRSGMYALALLCVLGMSLMVEFLSHTTRFIKPTWRNRSVLETLIHLLRVGFSYLLMLALMSFNGGVLLVAVFGHTLGFFFFNNKQQQQQPDKVSDLPPLSC